MQKLTLTSDLGYNFLFEKTEELLHTAERMWHEARKQEKKIKDAMIDYQKRAERRKEHYEKLVGVL